jgi:hypothetical protein
MSDRIERMTWLAASVGEVWDAITADGWLAEEVDLELRPGGDAEFRSGPETKTGWIEEAQPPREGSGPARLTFWWADDGEAATRVDLQLDPERRDADAGTRVRVVETRPLDILDLVGVPLPGTGGRTFGPALIAA